MMHVRARALSTVAPALLSCGILLSCGTSSPEEVLRVSLSNVDTFEYPTVSGDEDGTRVATQPRHAEVSEVRRNAETNWVVTYVYQPIAGYVGSDVVELEILTNPDGVSPPDVRRLTIRFSVNE
jgi:hypothetical protein